MSLYVSFPEKEKEKVLAFFEKEGIEHKLMEYVQDEILTKEINAFIEDNPEMIQDIYEKHGGGLYYENFLEKFIRDLLVDFVYEEDLFPGSEDVERHIRSVLLDYENLKGAV